MNNRNLWSPLASLCALLTVFSAACLSGCSGEDSQQPKQSPTPTATTAPSARSTPPSNAGTGGISATPATPSTNVAPSPPSMSATPSPSSSSPSMTQPPSADAGLTAKVLSVNGSGCPSGSATITATTADSVTLSIPGYSAQLGGDATIGHKRQNCLLVFDVSVPTGFTYALASASLSGTATLAAGVAGSVDTQYSFAGSTESASNTQPITADTSKWTAPGVFPVENSINAPCDAPSFLSLNTALVLSGESDTESRISVDPSVTLTFSLKKCP